MSRHDRQLSPRRRYDDDASPPRRRQNDDAPPPRRRYDDSASPPRRGGRPAERFSDRPAAADLHMPEARQPMNRAAERERNDDRDRQRYRSRSPFDRRERREAVDRRGEPMHAGRPDGEPPHSFHVSPRRDARFHDDDDSPSRAPRAQPQAGPAHVERGVERVWGGARAHADDGAPARRDRAASDARVNSSSAMPEDWGGAAAGTAPRAKSPEKPNFEPTGLLASDATSGGVVNGVSLRWCPPPEARVPSTRWILFVFKDGHPLGEPLRVHRQAAYLFGRDRAVADIPTDHPSCSSQHAALVFRRVPLPQEPGDMSAPVYEVKPYVIDLDSRNGTSLNGAVCPSARYVEARARDVLRFGTSTREYVLMHEGMAK